MDVESKKTYLFTYYTVEEQKLKRNYDYFRRPDMIHRRSGDQDGQKMPQNNGETNNISVTDRLMIK